MERRRSPNVSYIAQGCSYVYRNGIWSDPRRCPRGDDCEHAHTANEQMYHSDEYKKRMCSYKKKCVDGMACPNIHNKNETRIAMGVAAAVTRKGRTHNHVESFEDVLLRAPATITERAALGDYGLPSPSPSPSPSSSPSSSPSLVQSTCIEPYDKEVIVSNSFAVLVVKQKLKLLSSSSSTSLSSSSSLLLPSLRHWPALTKT